MSLSLSAVFYVQQTYICPSWLPCNISSFLRSHTKDFITFITCQTAIRCDSNLAERPWRRVLMRYTMISLGTFRWKAVYRYIVTRRRSMSFNLRLPSLRYGFKIRWDANLPRVYLFTWTCGLHILTFRMLSITFFRICHFFPLNFSTNWFFVLRCPACVYCVSEDKLLFHFVN